VHRVAGDELGQERRRRLCPKTTTCHCQWAAVGGGSPPPPCLFVGLSATSQQYFSLIPNPPPAISQQYFLAPHQPNEQAAVDERQQPAAHGDVQACSQRPHGPTGSTTPPSPASPRPARGCRGCTRVAASRGSCCRGRRMTKSAGAGPQRERSGTRPAGGGVGVRVEVVLTHPVDVVASLPVVHHKVQMMSPRRCAATTATQLRHAKLSVAATQLRRVWVRQQEARTVTRALRACLVVFSGEPGSHITARSCWTRLSACKRLLIG
jgi:hypothetical protein